jgi:FAD/FMN-containing dehydrogenase
VIFSTSHGLDRGGTSVLDTRSPPRPELSRLTAAEVRWWKAGRVVPRPTRQDLAALGRRLAGEVLVPGSAGYEMKRKPAQPRFHHVRPSAIALCVGSSDVAEVLAFGRESEIPLAVRGGGHCFIGRSSTEGLVLDLTAMAAVSVTDGTAIVEPGTRLGELYDRLDEHRVTLPAGCGSTVGIAGLTLGGGIGVFGRKHGLTCDSLRGASVVLADSQVVECDGTRKSDLFWALRGGGGNFGVVTSLVFQTFPSAAASIFRLDWPHSQAAQVVDAWQKWAPRAADEVCNVLRISVSGDGAAPPVVSMVGVVLASLSQTEEHLAEVVERCGCQPTHHLLETVEAGGGLKRSVAKIDSVASEETDARVVFSKSEFFRQPLTAGAIATLLRNLSEDRPPWESRELSFTPMGGSYNRVPPEGTAFVHREEQFLLEHAATIAPAAPASAAGAARTWAERSWQCVHKQASGGVYPNFPDLDLPDWQTAYYGANYKRLREIKSIYDPHGVLNGPQFI